MADQVAQGMESVSLGDGAAPPQAPSTEEPSGPPDVEINGKTYKPLADGDYDAVILSTGLEECVLAGLLSVRGMRVLQVDRNAFYGGQCSSLNLKELYEKHGRAFDENATQAAYGRSRDFCIDSIPKLLMANGKLVRMLLQTGVTRYIDFGGIEGSFVYQSNGKIYKLPVTAPEALTSSLVGLFQKNAMRKFAEFIRTYKIPKRVANTYTKAEFADALKGYYKVHNAEKVGNVDGLVDNFDDKRDILVSDLERKYGLPLFPQEAEVEFGPGSLCIVIEGAPLKKAVPADQGGPITRIVRVTRFSAQLDGSKGPAELSGKVEIGDIISKVNGENVVGLSDKAVQEKIVSAARPMKITFMKPIFDASANKYDGFKMTAKQLYEKFGLDETTQNFVGHAMALFTNDSYLNQRAEELIERCQLYGRSMGRFGQDSPYLFPMYGLSSLPESFSRLSAVYGGTVMLRTNVDEILFDPATQQATGIRVGDQAAKAKYIIGDASYFPPEMSKKTGRVIRSACILKNQIPNTKESCQVILPAKHLPSRTHDVYLSELSSKLHVVPKGIYLAIASTTVETNNPEQEVKIAENLMGNIAEKFADVSDCYAPVDPEGKNRCFIVKSLDATSHFETAAEDIERIYRAIFNKDLNLDEKLVPDQQE
mmetsp:Transcript_19257/g.31632  ORF Transcript_19257/g.31632 Transcript_19257/m.31632 type:complete len:652 (-) Transcript_19257:3-1958(-)